MPQRAALKPRALPTSGYTTVDADTLVEEEELPDYHAGRFYPVQLGELFQDRYQLVAKLGFGSSSTTWLARDLRKDPCFSLTLEKRESDRALTQAI